MASTTQHDDAHESDALALQQSLVDAVIAADGLQIRLAPPTYRVPGVPPIAIPMDAAPEGDGALRFAHFLGGDPDISAIEDAQAQQEYDEECYRAALRRMAGAAHRKERHFVSELHAYLFVTCEFFNEHRRTFTMRERARYQRVASSIWLAQSDVDASARQQRAVDGAMQSVTGDAA